MLSLFSLSLSYQAPLLARPAGSSAVRVRLLHADRYDPSHASPTYASTTAFSVVQSPGTGAHFLDTTSGLVGQNQWACYV